MTQPNPRIKYTVSDYMSTPDEKRFQLLDGEMILAPSPTDRHQEVAIRLATALQNWIQHSCAGRVRFAPLDVILSEYDVVQPDILYVSNERAEIVTEANIVGAPDLVIEILSQNTADYDRGYKRILYGRHGVREYWLVDPVANIVEVFEAGPEGLVGLQTFTGRDELTTPVTPGLNAPLADIFA